MSIPAFISTNLNQKVVYWANPVNDGYGSFTYDSPAELDCRCEHRTERVMNEMGDEVLSKAFVFLKQEVSEGDFMYFGRLTDSGVTGETDPRNITGAMTVINFVKIPRLGSSTEFIYKAYLNTTFRT